MLGLFLPQRKWFQANSAEKWNEESIKHSDHQQPLEPGGPPLIHLPKSPNMQKPWRDQTLKTAWFTNNHKQKVKKLPAPVGIMKVFRPTQDSQEISSFDMYRYVIITNLLLPPSYCTGPSECFPKEEYGFPSQYTSSYDHMINYGIPWSPRMCLFANYSWTSSCQEWTHRNLYASRTSWSLIWTHIICCHVVKT